MAKLNDPVAYLAEHYVYEINMLRTTYHALNSPRLLLISGDTFSWCVKNALIEAFSIHARVLLDFYLCNPRNDDVVATDFTVPGATVGSNTAGLPSDLKVKINKQVAHLTATRENTVKIDDSDRQTLFNAIEADHVAFKAAVRPQFSGCFSKETILSFTVPATSPSATNSIMSRGSSFPAVSRQED